jgi:hypothetical protein
MNILMDHAYGGDRALYVHNRYPPIPKKNYNYYWKFLTLYFSINQDIIEPIDLSSIFHLNSFSLYLSPLLLCVCEIGR